PQPFRRHERRTRPSERISDSAGRTLFDKRLHQRNRLRRRVIGSLSIRAHEHLLSDNVACPLPSESSPEYVDFFLGSSPRQREVSHSCTVPFVPYEASAGAFGARRVPSAKDDSGASSPQRQRLVTSVERAVILNGSALFDV